MEIYELFEDDLDQRHFTSIPVEPNDYSSMKPRNIHFNKSICGKRSNISSILSVYPDFRISEDGIGLFCIYCRCVVKHERKSVLDNHMKSKHHLDAQQTSKTVVESAHEQKSSQFCIDLVTTFLSSNTPLERIDMFRPFLTKYTPHADTIRPLTYIREVIVPQVFNTLKERIMRDIHAKYVGVMIDETTDRLGRSVVNIIFIYDGKALLAATSFVDSSNTLTTGREIMKVMSDYNISGENVIALYTDSVAYNLCAIECLQGISTPNALHIRCIAHQLHNICMSILNNKMMEDIHVFMSTLNLLFSHSKVVRKNYIDFLIERSKGKYTHIPSLFSASRWGTISDFLEDCIAQFKLMCTFFQTDKPKNLHDETLSLHEKLSILVAQDSAIIILEQLTFLHEHTKDITTCIRRLESMSSISHELYEWLKRLHNSMKIRSKRKTSSKYNCTLSTALEMFQELLSMKREQTRFLKACRILDPRNIHRLKHTLKSYQDDLKMDSVTARRISQDWEYYTHTSFRLKVIVDSSNPKNEYFEVISFWKDHTKEMPILSSFAIRCLDILMASAPVERSFNSFRNILTDRRTRTSECNLERYLYTYLNLREFSNDDEAKIEQ